MTGSRCSNRGSLTPYPAQPEVVVLGESQGRNGARWQLPDGVGRLTLLALSAEPTASPEILINKLLDLTNDAATERDHRDDKDATKYRIHPVPQRAL